MKPIVTIAVCALMLSGCANDGQKTAANSCFSTQGSTRLHACKTDTFGNWNGRSGYNWVTEP